MGLVDPNLFECISRMLYGVGHYQMAEQLVRSISRISGSNCCYLFFCERYVDLDNCPFMVYSFKIQV
jgi:hypothetical protein